MDPQGTTPAEGVELGGQAQETGTGYEICIAVSGDGSMTVSAEPKEADEGMEAPGTPAKDIGEALNMALEIFKAGGQMPQPDMEAQSMNAGFNKVKQVGM